MIPGDVPGQGNETPPGLKGQGTSDPGRSRTVAQASPGEAHGPRAEQTGSRGKRSNPNWVFPSLWQMEQVQEPAPSPTLEKVEVLNGVLRGLQKEGAEPGGRGARAFWPSLAEREFTLWLTGWQKSRKCLLPFGECLEC